MDGNELHRTELFHSFEEARDEAADLNSAPMPDNIPETRRVFQREAGDVVEVVVERTRDGKTLGIQKANPQTARETDTGREQ
jgi:hypothetical protein